MFFLNKIISRIKGEQYIIDENIELYDILKIVCLKFICLLRGIICTIGLNKRKGKVFMGTKSRLRFKKRISFSGNVNIGNYVEIDALSQKGVKLGNNVTIGNYSIIKCSGSLKKLGKGIVIGNNFGCGDWCYFGAAGGIKIGNDVIMGQNVRFHSENHNFSDIKETIRSQGVSNKGIIIGDDCWIGAGTTFLDGVSIGNGVVIGANTVVNKDIPSYSIAVGNPVKIIRDRKEVK